MLDIEAWEIEEKFKRESTLISQPREPPPTNIFLNMEIVESVQK